MPAPFLLEMKRETRENEEKKRKSGGTKPGASPVVGGIR
jgi:hypothetical protein